MIRNALFLLLIFYSSSIVRGQYEHTLTFGVTTSFNYTIKTPKRNFPTIHAFVNYQAQLNYQDVMANYSSTISIYNNDVGNTYDLLKNKPQLDWTNSASVAWAGERDDFSKYVRILGNNNGYQLIHNRHDLGGVSANYILNSSGRNQFVGTIFATFHKFSFAYYNDGGLPMNYLPISDNFDRFWTGGLGLFYHDDEHRNMIELTHDQFTGYQDLKYDLLSVFGIPVDDYGGDGSHDRSYNSGSYKLKIALNENFDFLVGIAGSLRTNRGDNNKVRYFGLQDWIHLAGKIALHPNYDHNRLLFGFTNNNMRKL